MASVDLRKFVVVLICGLVFLLEAYLRAGTGYLGLAVLTVAMLVVVAPYSSTSLGAVILFSAVALFIVPTFALIYIDGGVTPAWFALYILVALTMLVFFRPDRVLPAIDRPVVTDFGAIIVFLAIGLGGMALGGIEQVFHATYAISIVHLERIHASTRLKLPRLAALAIILTAIGFYTAVFWSGYGRLILTSFALAPILVAVHYRTFRLNVLAFSFGAGSLVFIGRVVRFGWSDGIAGLADDSGASPLTYTQGLFEGSASVIYNEPIWHQWSLLFVQWFPRSFWPDKPVGINYTFVDIFIGRQGLGEDHSTAIGFIGEHIFFAKDWWLVSVALLVVVITLTTRAVNRLAAPYAAPAIMFNSWLITLFWGGMADFGARVWFSTAPMLIWLLVLRRVAPWQARPEGRRQAPALLTAGRG